jgi:hypothetical protein
LASEPAATTLRPRQRWLLVGIPVVLLFGRGVKALVELALADTLPDRVGIVIFLAVLSMVAAVALVVVGRWGWVLAVAILGWGLVGELGLWWFGSPDYIALFLLTICAFLLTTPEMRAEYLGP